MPQIDTPMDAIHRRLAGKATRIKLPYLVPGLDPQRARCHL
jgi:hypothetical protein